MIQRKNPTAATKPATAKLTEKQVNQLVKYYCDQAGVTIEDVMTALKTIKVILTIRGGNTKFSIPAEWEFTDSNTYEGNVCSVGVTLTSDLDGTRTFKCGLKDAISFALLLP